MKCEPREAGWKVTMKEGSEGDGGGSSDDLPTSRDADSTVSNGGTNGPRMGMTPTTLSVHDGLPLGGTTLANALLGITLDRSATNGNNKGSNGDALLSIHSTNLKVVKGNGDSNGQNREKAFVCNICRRSFGYKHVLQNHERTHTGEKPFECKECHKRFTRDHHLKTHMRLHTGEKPYHCSHCERQFVQVANLRRHLRVHTGERPYACTLCNSCFSDSNQLKAHRLIHEGIKPFECEKCSGRFRRRHHLVHHKCPKDAANIGKPRRGRRPKAYDELPSVLLPVKKERLPTSINDLPPPYDELPTMILPVKKERLATSITELPPPYDELPTMLLSSKKEHLSVSMPDLPPPPPTSVAVSLTSVITRGPSPPLLPQPAHMQQARRNHHPIHHTLLGIGSSNGGSRFHDTVQTGPLDMTVSSASAPVSVIVPRIPHTASTSNSSIEGVLDLSNSRSDSDAEPIEEEVDEEDDCIDEGVDSDSEEEEHLRMIACWKREDSRMHHNHHIEDLRRANGERYDSEGDKSNIPLHLSTTS